MDIEASSKPSLLYSFDMFYSLFKSRDSEKKKRVMKDITNGLMKYGLPPFYLLCFLSLTFLSRQILMNATSSSPSSFKSSFSMSPSSRHLLLDKNQKDNRVVSNPSHNSINAPIRWGSLASSTLYNSTTPPENEGKGINTPPLPSAPNSRSSSSYLLGSSLDNRNKVIPSTSYPVTTRALSGRSLLYLHFHKCAGTSFCEILNHHRYSRSPGAQPFVHLSSGSRLRNCNLIGDGPRTLYNIPRQDLTCKDRVEQLKSNHANAFFVERWLDPLLDLCPDEFLLSTILRDPVSRIISNTEFHDISIIDLQHWMTNSTINPKNAIWMGSAAVDNFYIRTLLGEEVFLLPLGEITRDHLEQAKAVLSKFEIVMILEDLKVDFIQAKTLLNIDLTQGKKKRSTGTERKLHWPTEIKDLIKTQNQLDIELYEWARIRAKEINEVILNNIND